MKILLHGYTYSYNYGDILYLKSYYNECINNGFDVALLTASNPLFKISEKVLEELSNPKIVTINEVSDYDALFICGGGMYCQKPNDNTYLRFMRFVFPVLYFLEQNKPVYIFGVDAGPFETSWVEKYIKRIFNESTICSVRNYKSSKYCNNIVPDSLLSLSIPKPNRKKQILIHCVRDYDTVFEDNVIPVLQKYYSEYELVFLSDNEFDITKTVFGKYGKLVNYTNSDEITNIIAESSFVITNKLHVGLIATLAGVSVISFPFFYEKVHRFYNDINELDRCVPIENITPELVKEKIDKYFNKPIILSHDYIEGSKENFKYLSQIKPNTNTIDISLKDVFNNVVNDIGKHWVFNLYYETEIRNLCNNKK